MLPIEWRFENRPGRLPISAPVVQFTLIEIPAVWMCGAGTTTSVTAELPLITRKNSVVTLADAERSFENSRWSVTKHWSAAVDPESSTSWWSLGQPSRSPD